MKELINSIRENLNKYGVLLFSMVFILYFYSTIIFSPNSYLFGNSGDGIKNYYTYAYQIKNAKDVINFDGMNYPFGEHSFYTDSHPLFSSIIRVIETVYPNISDYSIGILNFIMILSIFFTFLLLHRIFIFFKFEKVIAFVASASIGVLAPQIFRLTGHYALSYSVAIPITWLLLLNIFSERKNISLVLLVINNILWMYIHAYLGVLVISFSFFFWSFFFIKDIKYKYKSLSSYLLPILATVLPILLFKSFLFFTDSHFGRTDNPSGFFLYNAELDDILIANHPPLNTFFNLITPVNLKWEAWAYIGLPSALFFCYFVIVSIKHIVIGKANLLRDKYLSNSLVNASLFTSVILLVFALGVPFKQIPGLIDIFDAFKQLRATGRFAWAFYFVFIFFFFFILNKNYDKKWVKIVIPIVFFVYMIEALPYHQQVSKNIIQVENKFTELYKNENYRKVEQTIDFSKFQALIPFPFYHHGSESFTVVNSSNILEESMLFSYHFNIPMLASQLSRTSIQESKLIISTLSPSFYPKPYSDYIQSNKPFLILYNNQDLSKYQEDILKKATFLLENKSLSFYSISPKVLFENTAQIEYDNFKKIKLSLVKKQGFLLTNKDQVFYYKNFDEQSSDINYRGKGSFNAEKKGKNVFAEIKPNILKPNIQYKANVWMYNNYKDALNLWFRLQVEEYDAELDKWYETRVFPERSEVINGNWSLVEIDFEIHNSKNKIYFVTYGKENSKAKLKIDDLLVREAGLDVYSINNTQDSSVLFKNNHRVFVKAMKP